VDEAAKVKAKRMPPTEGNGIVPSPSIWNVPPIRIVWLHVQEDDP
jgi:hypothetical protein